MTVGLAAICHRRYGERDGYAIISASDRMITRLDVDEYEPPTTKCAELAPGVLLLIAGITQAHSEALTKTEDSLAASPKKDVGEIAEIYASHIRAFRLRLVTHLYLSTVGLTHENLLNMENRQLASDITNQMQTHRFDCEAIVAGFSGESPRLRHINSDGFVTAHENDGFVSIGIGSSHVESEMMTARFTSEWLYHETLFLAYSAKKRAEVAAGVGKSTDMMVVAQDKGRVEHLDRHAFWKIGELFDQARMKRDAIEQEAHSTLSGFLSKPPAAQLTEWLIATTSSKVQR